MKRKAFLFFAFFLLLRPFFALSVSAYSDENLNGIAENTRSAGIGCEYLEEGEIKGEKRVDIFTKTFLILKNTLSRDGKGIIKRYFAVFAVIILCAVMDSFSEIGEGMTNICSYISVISLSAVSYSVIYDVFVFVTAALKSLTLILSSFLPVMASLYAYSANYSVAAANSSALTLFLTFLSALCSDILLPLARILFAFALSTAMPEGADVSGFSNLIKSTFTFILGFVFTVFGFSLTFGASVASGADNYFTKSIKFVSGAFLPVIGSTVGDAAKTVFASVSLVKGTFGVCAAVIILSAVIPPFAAVLINRIMISLCASAAKAFGCERESKFLSSVSGAMGLLMSVTVGAGAVCLIAVAVFVKTGNTG